MVRKLTLAVLLVATTTVMGQMGNMPGMDHKQTIKVNGADRPDLIQDAEAYRLVFNAIATAPETLRNVSGLTAKDRKAATYVLVAYQVTFQTLLKNQGTSEVYNPQSQQKFLADANDLVKRTRQELANHMTADGYHALEAYVQNEKGAMTTTTIQ
jgi:hypothetical protein